MDLKTKSKSQLKKMVESLNLELKKNIEDLSKIELISILENNDFNSELSQPEIKEEIKNIVVLDISPLEKRKWGEYIKRCGLTPKEFLILYPTHPAIQIIKTL